MTLLRTHPDGSTATVDRDPRPIPRPWRWTVTTVDGRTRGRGGFKTELSARQSLKRALARLPTSPPGGASN